MPSEARAAASEDGNEAREADAVAEAGQAENQKDKRENDGHHFLEALLGAVHFEIISADAADLNRARAELADRPRQIAKVLVFDGGAGVADRRMVRPLGDLGEAHGLRDDSPDNGKECFHLIYKYP